MRKKDDIQYRLEITWSQKDEAYVVNVPELSGCMTHGKTIEEAIRMAREAVEVYLESLEARGITPPAPFSRQKFSGKIPLRLDPNLHRDLAIKAKIEGLSLNKFIESKLKKAS